MINEHIWTASGTDIEERWIKSYGWVRPSDQPEYQAKWKFYQELPLRKVEYEMVLKKAKVVRVK